MFRGIKFIARLKIVFFSGALGGWGTVRVLVSPLAQYQLSDEHAQKAGEEFRCI